MAAKVLEGDDALEEAHGSFLKRWPTRPSPGVRPQRKTGEEPEGRAQPGFCPPSLSSGSADFVEAYKGRFDGAFLLRLGARSQRAS